MNDIDSLVIKQGDDKLHRWKTWKPNTPFAPSIDLSIYVDDISLDFTKTLLDYIISNDLGDHLNDAWKTYNIFDTNLESLRSLREIIWCMYQDYCKSIDVESYPRDEIWIRGWALRLEEGEEVPVHSHSLHENTFVSGNMSLTQNYTTTDYWIPLFSLYHGSFKCQNEPGRVALFPSWVQHSVQPNQSGVVRYSLAFDMFSKTTFDYLEKNNSEDPIISLSVPL